MTPFRSAPVSPANSISDTPSPGVTTRAVILCLILALFFGYIVPLIDMKLSNSFLGATHFPAGALGALFVLVIVINPLLGLLSKRAKLRRNECLVVYISCLFSCLVPGHGAENFIVGNLVGPFYFASSANKWLDFLGPNIKPWLSPALNPDGSVNLDVASGWYLGNGGQVPWAAWLVPLLAWGSVILASYVMLGCLSVILNKQWGQREALSFPLLKLPLEMVEDIEKPRALPFWTNKVMWTGFGVTVFIQLMRGLHVYFRDVPDFPLNLLTASLFTEAPWNQIGEVTVEIWPIAVGIAFLLTSEVSFSLWFFFWFIKLQYIAFYLAGYPLSTLPATWGTQKVVTSFQSIGAYWMLAALMLWTGREHFLHVARRAFGRERAGDDEKNEPLSYPLAFWGFLLSLGFIVAWSMAAGLRIDVALAFWATYLVISLGLSRLIAEGGLLFVAQGWMPMGFFATLTGSGAGTWLPVGQLAPLSFLQAGFAVDMRGFIMPSFVQSFKLARDNGIKARPLLALIAAVVCITLVMGMWMNVRQGYEIGGLQLNPWAAVAGAKYGANPTAALQGGVPHAGWIHSIWFAIGAGLTWLLMIARSRFAWFPFHPLGYLVCTTYPMQKIWFSTLIGWAAKTVITRFGGNEATRKAVPFFCGLALGDIAMILFWLLIDGWQGRTNHFLIPN